MFGQGIFFMKQLNNKNTTNKFQKRCLTLDTELTTFSSTQPQHKFRQSQKFNFLTQATAAKVSK